MPAKRRLYGLASSADGVISYVGITTRLLRARLASHHQAARDTDSPLARWIRSTKAAGHHVRIVLLNGHSSLAEEKAEIQRRVAAGESLLNVINGAIEPNKRPAVGVPVDAESHGGGLDAVACPSWLSDLVEAPQLRHRPPTDEGWTRDRRAYWMAVMRPIVPREPLHPHIRSAAQLAALAAARAARVAAEPVEREVAA